MVHRNKAVKWSHTWYNINGWVNKCLALVVEFCRGTRGTNGPTFFAFLCFTGTCRSCTRWGKSYRRGPRNMWYSRYGKEEAHRIRPLCQQCRQSRAAHYVSLIFKVAKNFTSWVISDNIRVVHNGWEGDSRYPKWLLNSWRHGGPKLVEGCSVGGKWELGTQYSLAVEVKQSLWLSQYVIISGLMMSMSMLKQAS